MSHGLRDLILDSDAPRDLILLSYHVVEEEAGDELTGVLVGGIHDVINWQTHDHVVAIFICCRISTGRLADVSPAHQTQ